jgi:hypothetical protein
MRASASMVTTLTGSAVITARSVITAGVAGFAYRAVK